MKTEIQQLERLKVGRCLVEREGRALAKEIQVGLDLEMGVDPKDPRDRSVSPGSVSLELWNPRANVVS